MQPSSEELKKMMRAKTDMELYSLLHVHSQDYALYALGIAEEEFKRRQLDQQEMRRTVAAAEQGAEEKTGSAGPAVQKPLSAAKETATGWGCLILLCFVGYAIYSGYGWLDSIGWISHREETVITVRNDWLVEESKECWSAPNDYYAALAKKFGGVTVDKSGKIIDDSLAAYVMSSVVCDDGPQHKMKVVFYGREFQDNYKVLTWRCTRQQPSFFDNDSFICYQTGGHR